MKTKLKKKILTFVLIFNVLTLSFVPCVNTYKTEAAAAGAATVAQIAGYFLSVTGALNIASNGGVSRISGSVLDGIKSKISSLMGTGIYKDSNGNYVFSGSATQELYEALSSEFGSTVRVVGSFKGITPSAGLLMYNSAMVNSDMSRKIDSYRGEYSSYMMTYWHYDNTSDTRYVCTVYNLDDVAFISVNSNNQIVFYNASAQAISIPYKSYYQKYSDSSGSLLTSAESTSNTTSNIKFGDNLNGSYLSMSYYCSAYDFTMSQINTYRNFPFSQDNGSMAWANSSILLCSSSGVGYDYFNKQSGIVVNNTPVNIPSISETTINNNDWDSIYNSYVTNVNNNKNEYYVNNTTDNKKLLQYMKQFNNNITNAINDGVEDLENVLLETNDWLQRIYKRISILEDILNALQNGDSSGDSSCEWTPEHIQSMLDWLEDIEGNTADLSYIYDKTASIDTKLGSVYTLLGQILSALQNGGGGSGGTPSSPSYTIPNTKVPWNDLDDLTTENVTDYIDNADIIENLLEDTMLVASIMLIGNVINGLASDPVTPHWTIPFKLTSSYTGADIDEDFDIDFNDFDFTLIHNVLIGGQVIIFTILCAWMFLNLLKLVIDLFF